MAPVGAVVVGVLAVPVVLGALEVQGADVAQVQERAVADVVVLARVVLVWADSRAAATSATSSAQCRPS